MKKRHKKKTRKKIIDYTRYRHKSKIDSERKNEKHEKIR
jgi:hypothetical protein